MRCNKSRCAARKSVPRPTARSFSPAPLLTPAGTAVHWIQQWTPEQFFSFYQTGCTRVEKIRQTASGEYFVFANGGGAAKAFDFTLGTLALLSDLSTHAASDATDAARLNDKIFVVTPSKLLVVDLDSGQISLKLSIDGETRAPRFVETVAHADGSHIIIALFVDETLSSARTRCYDMTWSTPKLLWALDEAATRVFPNTNGLTVACGMKYFSTNDVVVTPTLGHTFSASITALENARVGLQNGAVWRYDGTAWIQEIASGAHSIDALSAWEGAGDDLLGVAGASTLQLLEELAGGAWIDARTIEPGAGMSETITGISALARYEKIITPASGTPGQAGYVPAVKTVALLIGTSPSGVLAVLELSALSEESGALKASRVSHLNIDAYGTPTI